ncbi:MAG TPA: PTS sugar transporter subunit IIA [Anaerolineaceae bacterium]|nr:PTS sugar transporter subunit IIA [Anaerolineaceae bacterium]
MDSLKNALPAEQINLNVSVNDWQEAVREAGQLLLEAGAVSPQYIDAMIQTAKELGPYIVIAKGIAMPHAASEAGAKRAALSLVKLAHPIEFGNPDNDPVELVIGLAAIDGETHMNTMRMLAELIIDRERVSRLFAAQTKEEILQVIAQ